MTTLEPIDGPPAGTDLSVIVEPRILRALDWWRGLPRVAGHPVPDRAALDPMAIPELLPHVVLWGVTWPSDGKTGFDFHCRLAGTFMVDIHGYEFTGSSMADFHGAENARIQPEYEYVLHSGRPHYAERSLFWMNRDYMRYCRILLPFASRGLHADGRVALILNVSRFYSA